MATITLITSDPSLGRIVRLGLGRGDVLVVDPHARRRLARSWGAQCVVAYDCRGLKASDARGALLRLHSQLNSGVRLAALTSLQSAIAVHSIVAVNGVASDVVLADVESPGIVLKAIANDPFDSLQTVVAYTRVSYELPEHRSWIEHVVLSLGRRPAVTSVKELAKTLGIHRRTIERKAAHIGPITANDVVDVSLAAVCMLWAAHDRLSDARIAKAVGYADARAARDLVERVFRRTMDGLREIPATVEPTLLLQNEMREWRRLAWGDRE